MADQPMTFSDLEVNRFYWFKHNGCTQVGLFMRAPNGTGYLKTADSRRLLESWVKDLNPVPTRDEWAALEANYDEKCEHMAMVNGQVVQALAHLGVDISFDGYIPDSWTLVEQCKRIGDEFRELVEAARKIIQATERGKGLVLTPGLSASIGRLRTILAKVEATP